MEAQDFPNEDQGQWFSVTGFLSGKRVPDKNPQDLYFDPKEKFDFYQ